MKLTEAHVQALIDSINDLENYLDGREDDPLLTEQADRLAEVLIFVRSAIAASEAN